MFSDFQCWNFDSTDNIRGAYRTNINNLRSSLAKGDATGKNGKLPQGKNIYRLDWDCMLEVEAQKVVDKCDATASAPSELSMVIASVPITTCDPITMIKPQVNKWWNTVKNAAVDGTSPTYSNKKLHDFAMLAHGSAVKLGCAQRNCNGKLVMACMLYPKGPDNGQPIYEKGGGCTKLDNGDVSTGTMCPQNSQMSTDDVRREFLNAHNGYRSTIAQGKGVMSGGIRARPASQMRKMEYDCEAEKLAYNAVCGTSTNVENRMTFANANKDPAEAARLVHLFAVRRWYNEIQTGTMAQQAGDKNLYSVNLAIPRFAKVVWETNVKLGCAVRQCNGKLRVLCIYSNSTFGVNQQIYKMGGTCNRCKNVCDNNTGLCPSNWTPS
ncbi:SCP-like protein [Necator americanus]|uniref:SCP-like protein n=1 Tax=Necator americanus TaxID=51031 RepID=W2SGX9_NECAM|nr:SCP-like protein [Necator americanus]ETN68778.1 SCP-like protein [Necator americanus]